MKKSLFLIPMISLFGLFILVSGCKKDPQPNPNPDWEKKMEDLVVPNGFNYNSTFTATITVTMPFTVDYTTHRSRVDIMTAPEEAGGIILQTGSVNAEGVYMGEVTLPDFYDSVYVKTEAGSAWVILSGTKSSSGILDGGLNLGNGYDTIPPMDTTFATKQGVAGMRVSGREITPEMVVQNLITNGTFDDNNFLQFSDWTSPMQLNQTWYYTASFQNGFTRYNDNGNYCARVKVPTGTSLRSGGLAQLVSASPGDLITFTADYKHSGGYSSNNRVWLFIIPRNAAGNSITFYSYEIPNASFRTSWTDFTIAATMPSGTESVQILLWQWIFSGYHYFDNVVVTGPVNDSDGDGVDDEQDEYPNDPNRAYNVYYPSANTFNSLAFEDNWPGKGDYDFNDLVVDYQYHQVTNADNDLVDLNAKFVIRAIGASMTNGFGFEMGMDPEKIGSVTGTSITENYVTLMNNGAEAGQEKGTIIVSDNVFTQLPPPGGGTGVNTEPGGIYVTPTTMNIAISFTEAIPIAEAGTPPYNPFMIINRERGREVHLPDEPPTSLANPAYFGTGADDSNPATGKYYKTSNNLPWGIDIPYEFAYPIERAVILQAYLHFATWAESGGAQYSGWYLDEAGNRNDAYIYTHQ